MLKVYAGTRGFSCKEWKGPFYSEADGAGPIMAESFLKSLNRRKTLLVA